MNRHFAGLVLDLAWLAAITVLLVGHSVPESTVVALLPYIALRSRRWPSWPPRSGGLAPPAASSPPRAPGRARRMTRAIATAALASLLWMFDPLAEVTVLAAGVIATVRVFSPAR